ncbi:MAG: insulinase family protein [Erysipelotrichaceae bacterium]|nr:insulinase family protein [Erysipelotrichaceae bacterium]
MEIIRDDNLQENLYFEEMKNGLKVYLLPKPGFSKTYGLFSTRFGSIDTTFIPLNETEMITVPDGVAHFLEHKMFEMSDGDASDKFAALGAQTNAFTSSTRTAYLFNTTSHENECIELLLDFVQDIYLTDENVEKEKGIINQEIGMYDDDPDWRCYFGSIQNLYNNHPVKIDIAGTVETVAQIDKEILEKCYHTFYHPNNMMLFVVGNINAEDTMKLIRNNQDKKHFDNPQEIIRKEVKEDDTVPIKDNVLHMDVIMPKLIVSIKVNDILKDPKLKLKRELAMNVLLDLLFAKSSNIFESWSREGIINDSFSANFTQERDYSFIQIGGDSDSVDELKKRIYDLIDHMDSYKIDQNDFERVKKKNIGQLIGIFNSPESIASMFSRYYFEGSIIFDLIHTLNDLTLDDIYECQSLFNKEYTSSFLINKE